MTFKNSALESRNVILNLLIHFGDRQSVHVMISQLRHKAKCDGVDCDGVYIFIKIDAVVTINGKPYY